MASKVKTSYCKQHGKFDTCAEEVAKGLVGDAAAIGRFKVAQGVSRAKVALGKPGGVNGGKFLAGAQGKANMAARKEKKALGPLAIVPKQRVGKRHGPGGGDVGDDGIHHLTDVSRVKTSRETRTGGLVPLLETGRSRLNGTPKTGRGDASVSSKISGASKAGASGRSKPVGSSKIREQVGKSLSGHAAFLEDVSKASAFGTHGDKRNTKYALAGHAGASVGSGIGGRVGAKAAGEKFSDVKAGGRIAAQEHMVNTSMGDGGPKDMVRALKGGMKAAHEVPGYSASIRGSKIGAAVGLAGGAGAYAAHRRKKGLA